MTAQSTPPISYLRVQRLVSYTVLIIVTVLILTPILWLVISSFKADTEFLSYPIEVLPHRLRGENYQGALTIIDFGRYVRNSTILAVTFSTLTVLTSSLAGFAFARIPAPGRNWLFSLIVALLMVPYIVYVIPQFIIFSKLGLVDTYWPWVLWGLSASPFHIFLFR